MTDHVITLHSGQSVCIATSSGGTVCHVGHFVGEEETVVTLFDSNTLVTGPESGGPEVRARELFDGELTNTTA